MVNPDQGLVMLYSTSKAADLYLLAKMSCEAETLAVTAFFQHYMYFIEGPMHHYSQYISLAGCLIRKTQKRSGALHASQK